MKKKSEMSATFKEDHGYMTVIKKDIFGNHAKSKQLRIKEDRNETILKWMFYSYISGQKFYYKFTHSVAILYTECNKEWRLACKELVKVKMESTIVLASYKPCLFYEVLRQRCQRSTIPLD